MRRFITSATAFGNAPVAKAYGVTGPSTKDADASIRRTFGPVEKTRLTIGADVFNLTNHVEATGLKHRDYEYRIRYARRHKVIGHEMCS